MHRAHLFRRARWYCLLSESSLALAPEENPQRRFDGGGKITIDPPPHQIKSIEFNHIINSQGAADAKSLVTRSVH